MGTITVIAFTTLDGVVEDPDGSGGTPFGGWAFRSGPAAVADDKFRLGSALDTCGLLLGRRTWQLFSTLWPSRTDPFARRMNAATKWVASSTLGDVSAWSGSTLVPGDVTTQVARLRQERDVVVVGSTSLVHDLARRDLVDEYRLLVFAAVAGAGARLFEGAAARDLRLLSAEQTGLTALLRYGRATSDGTA